MLLTRNAFAKLHNVDVRTVAVWIQKGFIIRESGKIDVEKSAERLKQFHPTAGNPRRPGPDLTFADLKSEKLALEILWKRLLFDIKIGNVVPKSAANDAIGENVNIVRNLLHSLGSKIAPRLSGTSRTSAQIRALLDARVEFDTFRNTR
jgi:hypothetical protein